MWHEMSTLLSSVVTGVAGKLQLSSVINFRSCALCMVIFVPSSFLETNFKTENSWFLQQKVLYKERVELSDRILTCSLS